MKKVENQKLLSLVKDSKYNQFTIGDNLVRIRNGKNNSHYYQRVSDGLVQRVHTSNVA